MSDHVVLLGVKGGPAIRPGSSMPTSILVSIEGRKILVDAGLGVSRAICSQGLALTELDAIFVTHLHSDHYLELGPLLHTMWVSGLNREVPVYGPAGLDDYLRLFLESMDADIALRVADEGRPDLAGLIRFRELGEDGDVTLGAVTVRAMRNLHPPLVDSFALRFETVDRTVVLSGDTAFLPAMADFAKGADLLVHEAMLTDGVDAVVRKAGNGDERLRAHILRSHTSAADAGRVAAAAGVRRLALNHFVPEGLPGFGDAEWMADVRLTWDGPVLLGRDGMRIGLGDD